MCEIAISRQTSQSSSLKESQRFNFTLISSFVARCFIFTFEHANNMRSIMLQSFHILNDLDIMKSVHRYIKKHQRELTFTLFLGSIMSINKLVATVIKAVSLPVLLNRHS